ncbi:IS66 family insertion sequence element accessory protein TnpB [Bradyrhizobium sp. ORS 86]
MDDHSDDIRRPLSPRIEVYAGAGRKRWPDDLKAQIAAESLEPGAIVTDVARRHGCRPQQVHDWRRRARLGQLVLPASADTLSFVPVVSESALPAAAEATGSPEAAVVTVELQGARVEVRGTPGLAVLSDVLGASTDTFMLMPPASLMIYVATQPVDFRKGAEGLALLAKETLGHDPMKGVAVVFRAKRADRVKIVVWDGSGLVMYWKRLDGSGFKWPPIVAGVMRMNAAQLSALLAGMDWTRMHAPRILQPKALA